MSIPIALLRERVRELRAIADRRDAHATVLDSDADHADRTAAKLRRDADGERRRALAARVDAQEIECAIERLGGKI